MGASLSRIETAGSELELCGSTLEQWSTAQLSVSNVNIVEIKIFKFHQHCLELVFKRLVDPVMMHNSQLGSGKR